MPLSGLETCPVCERSLAHIAPPARCPDCGFPFDRRTRVWRSAESWPRLALLYLAGGLIVGLLVTLLERAGRGQVANPAVVLLFALLAPAIGLPVRRVLGGRITGRFVALAPPGIVIGTRGRPRLVPWANVRRLAVRRGIPRIETDDSPVPIPLDDIFANPAELAHFRAALSAAARCYGGGPGASIFDRSGD